MEPKDRDLLERFVASRDEAAFAALVRRHAPLVMGVCRRILRTPEDAEDAFQATFIVLSKKASSIKNLDSISSWLHGVAARISLKSKSMAALRRLKERRIAQMTSTTATELETSFEEVGPAVDQELGALPEKYRKALVLCYLEGKTNEAAARELGWPVGSIFQRLEKGRELLRSRLLGRGVAVTSALLLSLLMEKTLFAATVPPALAAAASKIAVLALAGEAGVAAPVAALVKSTLQALFAAQMKIAGAVVLAVGLVGSAAGVATWKALRTDSIEDPVETARIERRIAELQPTAAERRIDEIGWAPDLLTAKRLARETGRPMVVVSHVGDLATGRFDGGGLGARWNLLSDRRVISLLNRAFVCVYTSNEDFAEKGKASPQEKGELGRIYHEALAANLQAGDESIYLVGPDGRIVDLLPGDASQALPILERARDRFKPREGRPVVKPAPQSRPPAHGTDNLVLHLVARYVDAGGAPEKEPRQTWHELPAENWLVYKRSDWSRLLPNEECVLGMSWTPASDVARLLLIHFYPATEDLLRDDAGRSKVEKVSLLGRIVALRGATVRARLEGKIRMLRRFHAMVPQHAPNVLEATVIGFLEFEPSGRILSLKLTTDRAMFGDSPFAVAVQSR